MLVQGGKSGRQQAKSKGKGNQDTELPASRGSLSKLKDLPAGCWVDAEHEVACGTQYITRVHIADQPYEIMLDGGSGVNTIPEKILVEVLN